MGELLRKEVFLEQDTIIVSQTNSKGEIIFANADFCKIAGFRLDELVGKPHNLVRDKDIPSWAFEDLWKTIKAGKIWKGIVKNRTKNGGFYWVNATVFPSKNSNGEIRYVSVRVKPTNKELEEAKKLYKIG
ncbi:PAS domain-containing protein [Aliarcobacter skirrowii]|jgi:aerotaxis receptor|uniref:PAS domain-containing protein n=2 Tax=Aliarcobacter skirrowii TaxID=28200 RepID=A0A2U2C1Q9_9BACT|nr:PAS domain-containing protein [Aliarcobacter skirrowii]AXX85528.1 PAS sensor-containing signal transduction protein [Aliarcobacter skirrowii CCUG 10374]KAB0621063.1 PAS domain-containing protein [Aliarcobacter skirrowii CCUG 10374]MDX4011899.1 PAS domain-containing protein [Aliarcobacter skirrowii]MDX4025872.1 PAS domain-containing protein [Aliarcobacter skirrowii]MDX4062144.1 PAS domain-containing protein [Aliarcobacter skirrowii]